MGRLGMRVRRFLWALEETLQPGRLPVLAVLLAAMLVAALVAVLAGGTWRWRAVAVLAVLAVVGKRAAPWLLERRYPRYPAVYRGTYPPFPASARVLVAAEPDGLAVYMGRKRERRRLLYGHIFKPDVVVGQDGVRRLVFTYIDRIAKKGYRMQFAIAGYAADELLLAILRRDYREADTPWALWRPLTVELPCTPEELRRGCVRAVPFTRQVVCAWCAGIPEIRPHCRTCGGQGVYTEQDVVQVTIPAGSRPGWQVAFREKGNEDINGLRGPLRVRVTLRNESGDPESSSTRTPGPGTA